MALTISEQNWLALQAATRLAADLTSLLELIRDNRASAENIRATLKAIADRAEFVRQFCEAAEKRTNHKENPCPKANETRR